VALRAIWCLYALRDANNRTKRRRYITETQWKIAGRLTTPTDLTVKIAYDLLSLVWVSKLCVHMLVVAICTSTGGMGSTYAQTEQH
jgi:hypothetical protein